MGVAGAAGQLASFQISGLRALRRDLKKVDADLPKRLKEILKGGAEIVAEDTAGQMPRVSGAAAGSVRAFSAGSRAGVRGGKMKVPYWGWLVFGPRKSGQAPKGGRWLYPTIARRMPDVMQQIERDLDALFRETEFN